MLKHSSKQSISSMLHPTPSIWTPPPHRRGLPRFPFFCSTLVLKPGTEPTPGTVLSCHPGVLFPPSHAFLFLYLVPSWGGTCPCWITCRTGVFPKPPVSLQTTISGPRCLGATNPSNSGWSSKVQGGASLISSLSSLSDTAVCSAWCLQVQSMWNSIYSNSNPLISCWRERKGGH